MENIQDMVLTGDSGGMGKAGRVMAPHGAGGLYLQSVVVRDGLCLPSASLGIYFFGCVTLFLVMPFQSDAFPWQFLFGRFIGYSPLFCVCACMNE